MDPLRDTRETADGNPQPEHTNNRPFRHSVTVAHPNAITKDPPEAHPIDVLVVGAGEVDPLEGAQRQGPPADPFPPLIPHRPLSGC